MDLMDFDPFQQAPAKSNDPFTASQNPLQSAGPDPFSQAPPSNSNNNGDPFELSFEALAVSRNPEVRSRQASASGANIAISPPEGSSRKSSSGGLPPLPGRGSRLNSSGGAANFDGIFAQPSAGGPANPAQRSNNSNSIRIVIAGKGYKLGSQNDLSSLLAQLDAIGLRDADGDTVSGFDALQHQQTYELLREEVASRPRSASQKAKTRRKESGALKPEAARPRSRTTTNNSAPQVKDAKLDQEGEEKEEPASSASLEVDLDMHQKWYREQSSVLTKVGFNKHVAKWAFMWQDEQHTAEIHHSAVSGKRKFIIDGEVRYVEKNFWNPTCSRVFDLSGGPKVVRLSVSDQHNAFNYSLHVDGLGFIDARQRWQTQQLEKIAKKKRSKADNSD